MALNVHITRIEANPIYMEQSHPQITFVPQNNDWPSFAKNTKTAAVLVNVPDDRNIRKFPVRIFDIPAEELKTSA
ncbi:MAG: hypothetical protein ABI690_35720 [Chloroflexota bacterium]